MRYALLTLLLLPVATFAQNFKALDQKNGFRDLIFGADTTALATRVRQPAKNPNVRIYSRPTDELKIGGAELVDIYYYKNHLSDVLIHTKGISNSRALLEALESTFGSAVQPNRYLKDYSWRGKVVFMNYDENSITNDASVFITSQAISKQKREDDAAAAKAAKSDL
jgi:hypothetical protein